MELHDIIRKLRQKKDLTQESIAFDLGVDKTTIGRYEKDASSISLERLEKLASIFKMTVPQMLSYDDEPEQISNDPLLLYSRRGVKILIELDGSVDGFNFLIGKLDKNNKSLLA